MTAGEKISNQRYAISLKHAREAEIDKPLSSEILTHSKLKFKGSKNSHIVDILEVNETGFHIAIDPSATVSINDECSIEWKSNGGKLNQAAGVVRKTMKHGAIIVILIEHQRSMLSRLLFWNK